MRVEVRGATKRVIKVDSKSLTVIIKCVIYLYVMIFNSLNIYRRCGSGCQSRRWREGKCATDNSLEREAMARFAVKLGPEPVSVNEAVHDS